MKPYVPQYVGTVTKYVFVDSPNTTPQDIATAAYEIAQGVMIKRPVLGARSPAALRMWSESSLTSETSIPIASM